MSQDKNQNHQYTMNLKHLYEAIFYLTLKQATSYTCPVRQKREI